MSGEIPYEEMESEVVPLCRALNCLPGIRTSGSCCGHDKGPLWVLFDPVVDLRGIFLLHRALNQVSGEWQLSVPLFVNEDSSFTPFQFRLSTVAKGEEAYLNAKELAEFLTGQGETSHPLVGSQSEVTFFGIRADLFMPAPRVSIPKVESTHRGSAGWFLSDGSVCQEGVHLVCGGCGKHAGDLRNHTIKEDGTVHASILCPNCGWHVWGTLEHWRGRDESRQS